MKALSALRPSGRFAKAARLTLTLTRGICRTMLRFRATGCAETTTPRTTRPCPPPLSLANLKAAGKSRPAELPLPLAGWEPSGYLMLMTFTRITIDPAICTGKPCIRGLRFPVARLLGLLAAGETREGILKAYPYLEGADIDEALRYAASLAEDQTVALAPAK
jgi:uncharacterized protein (DUF433 family)